jgi:hypothetical protein
MSAQTEDRPETAGISEFYREFLAERDEILRHKWIESEKAGCDIGYERALLDWVAHHRSTWRERRRLEDSHKES